MNVMDENLFIHHFRKKVYEISLDISLDISHLNFHLIHLWGENACICAPDSFSRLFILLLLFIFCFMCSLEIW